MLRCTSMALALLFCSSLSFNLDLAKGQSDGSRTDLQTQAVSNQTGTESRRAGGAAQADFTTLMNLITQTVDPENWVNSGGSSSMLPYPAGVWIDARGQLNRAKKHSSNLRAIEQRMRHLASSEPQGKNAWQTSSDLRMISLKRLDQLLVDASLGKETLAADAIRLAGLNAIHYVLVDADQQDLVLAGPANPDRLGFFLEDLAIVCASVGNQAVPLGCSIDPRQERLLDATRWIAQPDSLKQLSSAPKRFADQLSKLVGDYDITVFGMQPNCSTALALIEADELMKRQGFGRAESPIQVRSYFDHLESLSNQPMTNNSLVRWWFTYADHPISTNPQHTLFRLPRNCVQVSSEQQMVTSSDRRPSGKHDPAADAFATELSENLNQLRDYHVAYSRMTCIFESSLAFQVAHHASGRDNFRSWFPNLCELAIQQQAAATMLPPKSLPGFAATHTLKNRKTNIAVISGGVTIDPRTIARPENWQDSPLLSGSAVPALDNSAKNQSWWWD